MDIAPWYGRPEWWAIIFSTFMSLIAVTQPYWGASLRRLFFPKDVLIYNALLPDVNFGVAGSAIGLCGSLISKNAASLVTTLRVRAKRLSDGSEYTFEAMFNRKRSVTTAGDALDAGIWTVLQLPQDEPTAYDVTFCNDGARAGIKEINEATRTAWFKVMQQQIEPPLIDGPENAKRIAAANQTIFKDQRNGAFIGAATTKLLNYFYWSAGSYIIALEVALEGTKRIFRREWRITVTAEMEQNLRVNAWRMVATFCLQPPTVVGSYFTAWPQYEPPT